MNIYIKIAVLILTIGLKNKAFTQPPPCATCCVPVITVTSAPTMEASLKALKAQEEGLFQTEKLKYESIIKQAEKSYEIYTKVSEGIKNMQQLINFFEMEINIINNIKSFSANLNNSPELTANDIEMTEAFYKGIGTELSSIKDVVEQFTKSDNEMTSGERIEGINMALSKVTSIATKVNYFNEKMDNYLISKEIAKKEESFLTNIY